MVHVSHEAAGVTVENDVHVATMGLEPPSHYANGPDGMVRTADGRRPAILHQYDRMPAISAAIEARFAQ
jgi:hypothetical protein